MEEAAEGVGVFFAVGTGGEGRPVNVDGHFLEEGGSLWLIEWTWMFFRDEDPRHFVKMQKKKIDGISIIVKRLQRTPECEFFLKGKREEKEKRSL